MRDAPRLPCARPSGPRWGRRLSRAGQSLAPSGPPRRSAPLAAGAPKKRPGVAEEAAPDGPTARGPRGVGQPRHEDDRPLLPLCLMDRHHVHDSPVRLDALLLLADLLLKSAFHVVHELVEGAIDV